MKIEHGTHKSVGDDGMPLHFEITGIYNPADEDYPGPPTISEIEDGDIEVAKHGEERIIGFDRRGALYFPTCGRMFESDLVNYLTKHGFEYEEAECDSGRTDNI